MGHQFIQHSSNTAQESLLSKGPSFAKGPQNPPNIYYIATIESACQNLIDQDVEELRADINGLCRRAQAPKCNLTMEERKVLTELKRDKDRIVLTADKGVTMVVLDRQGYIEKAKNLLTQPAYMTFDRDPTNKLKAKLITALRGIKRESGLDEGT